jgi:hypothetical protein
VAAFVAAHQAALGQPYPVAGGRDGRAFTQALRLWDAPTIVAALPRYFADAWIRDHGPDVPKFCQRIPSLLHAGTGEPARGFVG